MKHISTLVLALLLGLGLLALGVTSCGSGGKGEQSDSTQRAEALASLPLDSIILRDTLYASALTKSGDRVAINFLYRFPQEDTTLQHLFNLAFFGEELQHFSPQDAMKEYIQLVRHEYLDSEEMIPYSSEEENTESSELSISNEIAYVDSLMLSISKEFYNYNTGAAHGMETTTFTNIDRRTKTIINEDDLFSEGFSNQLAEILRRCILRDYHCSSPEELQQKEGIDVSDISGNDNFAFTREGLVYCYNPYEVAPYAVGRVHIHIPYEELRPILRPGSLIYSYLPAN